MLKILFSVFLAGCALSVAACVPDEDDISGRYRFDKVIYINLASSYFPTKSNTPGYVITKKDLTILRTDGTEEHIAGSFEESVIDTYTFAALFQPDIGAPDISGFKQRHQYIINEQYRLYVMDNEIWLALCPRNTMWSIYRLVDVESDSLSN